MKVALILLILLALSEISFAQGDPGGKNGAGASLSLTGTVSKIEISERRSGGYSSSLVSLAIGMKLTNTGKMTVILLNDQASCGQIDVAQNVEDLLRKSGSYFLCRPPMTADFVGNEDWRRFVAELNVDRPPPEKTRILLPGETLDYETTVEFTLPSGQHKGLMVRRDQKSVDDLKKYPAVYIRLRQCNLRNYGFETDFDATRSKVSDSLRKRWKKYGYLWLDDIASGPILLDLKSAKIGP